jgi:hypothetical protein
MDPACPAAPAPTMCKCKAGYHVAPSGTTCDPDAAAAPAAKAATTTPAPAAASGSGAGSGGAGEESAGSGNAITPALPILATIGLFTMINSLLF